MQVSKSLIGKAKTIIENGIEPINQGVVNFQMNIPEIESLALERSKVCDGCAFFIKEPVNFLRIEDLRIPILSEMMCGECFCSSPYKLRQSITKCDKWVK